MSHSLSENKQTDEKNAAENLCSLKFLYRLQKHVTPYRSKYEVNHKYTYCASSYLNEEAGKRECNWKGY